MKKTVRDLTWLKSFLQENGIPVPDTSFYYDNQAIIYTASISIFHEKAKHMEVDFHFVCSKVDPKEIITPFASSKNQPTNIFANALLK